MGMAWTIGIGLTGQQRLLEWSPTRHDTHASVSQPVAATRQGCLSPSSNCKPRAPAQLSE